ncbi:MAG: right-handed parallel beta-helix repeat-containing protein [Ignavibacteriales bacterium]|nr:right-handed parallel beta-helix repeat-containing protein [Ignavibacteriales bacterium]
MKLLLNILKTIEHKLKINTFRVFTNLFILISLSLFAQSQSVYVSTTGNDNNLGTKEKPFATIFRAQKEVRLLISKRLTSDLNIWIRGGTYELSHSIFFDPEDSGPGDFHIIYSAYPGEEPIFNGGRIIKDFKQESNGLWKTQIPVVHEGGWNFEQLFTKGQRVKRAHSPNSGYYFMLNVNEDTIKQSSNSIYKFRQTISVSPEAIKLLNHLTMKEIRNIIMVVYDKWEITKLHLESIDFQKNSLNTISKNLCKWGYGTRYQLENYMPALDSAGEWFLDFNGYLFYKPLPGEDINNAQITAPFTDQFVVFRGNINENKLVKNIFLRGLTFQYGQYNLPENGLEPNQAAHSIDAMIMADGAVDIKIENCEIKHIGKYGIWFRNGCKNCVVDKCILHDLGAGGIRIGSEYLTDKENEKTGNIVVNNNIIQTGGQIFPNAVGIWVGQSSNNEVTHNDIGNFYYSGISVGWTWGYGISLAKNNIINFNHIHNIGWGVLSDMGGIYTLGESNGTIISNNVIHDVFSYSYGGYGIYLDEGSSNIIVENNLVYNTKTGGFFQHYGEKNIIRNNIFAFGKEQELLCVLPENHLSFTFENNIVYSAHGNIMDGPWKALNSKFNNNLYWSRDGKIDFVGLSFKEWQSLGRDTGSVINDPSFVDPSNYNFKFKDEKNIRQIGFLPFDINIAGVYGDITWTKLASIKKYIPFDSIAVPQQAPLLQLDEGFESTPLGRLPDHAICMVENKGDSIYVTDETSAKGKNSLKIVDAFGLQHTYDPHFYYSPHYTHGKITLSYDIKIVSNSKLFCEWRDWRNSSYISGPSISIADGIIKFGNNENLTLPLTKWIHIEMSANIGKSFQGNWDLIIVLPGNDKKVFKNILCQNKNFSDLTWLGFGSTAEYKTVFYIDNLKLSATENEK